MKRQTALALAAVFSLSVAGTALAATANPFVDVPSKHWAYDSINKLAQAGVITGYGDGTYKGDRTLTRYEMAVIIGKAMANSDKMDTETKKALDALKTEFSTELNNLGVRVDNVEKKIDNTKITGVIRARYDDNKVLKDSDQGLGLRTRIGIAGQINDEWTYKARLENTQDLTKGGNEDDTVLNQAYVSGKVKDVNVTFGRFDATPAYGIALDDTVDGGLVSFGNKLKVDLFAGRQNYVGAPDSDNTYIANLGYGINENWNVKGAYYYVDPKNGDSRKIWEAGMDYKLTPDISVTGAYLKSDADNNNKGVFAQVAYKAASAKEVGSYGVWVNYRKLDKGVVLSSTLDVAQVTEKVGADTVKYGGKGYEVGFAYTPFKNGLWTTSYTDLKGTEEFKDKKGQYFRTQVEFFF